MASKHEWRAGEEVFLERSHGWSDTEYVRARIAKVYKSGNFVLEGSTQQYRPDRMKLHAYATGDARYRSPTVVAITPETEAAAKRNALNIARKRRVNLAAKAMEHGFWSVVKANERDDVLDAIEALIADVKGEPA